MAVQALPGRAIFTCDGVSRHFGALKAVDGVSLVVSEGEILGMGGPNGAGKTTLFDVLTGLTPATSGRVWFGDHEITGLGADYICHTGVARTFQFNAAFETMAASIRASRYRACATIWLPNRLASLRAAA